LVKDVRLNSKNKVHIINVENILPGMYFVNIYNNSTLINSKKLIKK